MDPQRPLRTAASRPPIGRPGGSMRRRRRSRRTYLVRRIGALVVVVAVVYGLAKVATSVFGDDPTPATADQQTPATDPVNSGDGTAVDSTASTAVADPNAVTSSTTADAGRTPTAADPARIYIAGDSDAGGFAPFLTPILDKTGVVDVTLDYIVSTGLARPDFLDWPARFAQKIPAVNPDIVIVTFGGNDGQAMPGVSSTVDSDAWRAEYGKRVGQVMDSLSADGRTLIWVGIPNGPSADFTARLKVQNSVVLDQLAKHPDVKFIDAWNIFTGLDGGYALYVTDPSDGISKPVRQSTDGFHLNTDGEKILSSYIAAAVTADLKERGAAI